MLSSSFAEVYNRFRVNFYKNVFTKMQEKVGNLNATEAFSLEIIHALGRPTVGEFAKAIGVSQSGATYKITSLQEKGYLTRENSKDDKREYYLVLTDRYYEYANLGEEYMQTVLERVQKRFSPEALDKIDQLFNIIATELMEETDWMKEEQGEKNE